MKKLFILIIISLSVLINKNNTNTAYDLVISTTDKKHATLTASTTDFINNTFSVNVDIQWVNDKFKPKKNEKTVLAINKELIEIYPENAVIPFGAEVVTDFSNTQISVSLYANPDFEGGNVKLKIPIVSAESLIDAELGKWEEVLYPENKMLEVEYFINGELIIDIYPPKINVTNPVPNVADKEKIPIVEKKFVEFNVTAMDKGGVESITINGKKTKQKFTGEYYTKITLYTGMNNINIKATDKVGNDTTYSYEVLCTYQYDLQLEGGIYYALILGVNDYEDPNIPDLGNPISDAKKLSEILISQYTFDEANVFVLENPTRSKIIQEFEILSEWLTYNDNLIIFYAGHGYWDEYKEIGYWLPSDAVMGDFSTWIRNSTVKDYIGAIKSKHTLLITDACFSGSIFQTRSLNDAKIVAYQKIYDLPSRKGMTSGTLKEVPDISVFLSTLIKRLEQNEDKYLPVSKLFNTMRDAILNNSPNVPQFGTIQGVGDEGGEFIFIKK